MTTIKQLLEMPIGYRTGGFELTVKKYPSKMVEVDNKLLQPVVFIDDTGEIPGEIFMAKRVDIQKGWKVHITICTIQQGVNGKKLYVEQWWLPSMTIAEYEAKQYDFQQEMKYGEPINIVKGKCKMHVLCSMIRSGQITVEEAPLHESKLKSCINRWVDFILEDITGE